MRRNNRYYHIMKPILDYCSSNNLGVWSEWELHRVMISNVEDDRVRNMFRSISSRLNLLGLSISSCGSNQCVIQSHVKNNDLLLCPLLYSCRYNPEVHSVESTLTANQGWSDVISRINSEASRSCNVDSLRELINVSPMYNFGQTLRLIHEYRDRLQVVQCIPEYAMIMSWLYYHNTSVSGTLNNDLVILTSSVGKISDYFKGKYYVRITPYSHGMAMLTVHVRSRQRISDILGIILDLQALTGRLVALNQDRSHSIAGKCSVM